VALTNPPTLGYSNQHTIKTDDHLVDDGDQISIMDGSRRFASISKKHVQQIRVEQRSSFKHPAVAAGLVGLAVVTMSLLAYVGDPVKLGKLLIASPTKLAGGICVLGFVMLVLRQLIRHQSETWVIIELIQGEREFCVGSGLSVNEQKLIETINKQQWIRRPVLLAELPHESWVSICQRNSSQPGAAMANNRIVHFEIPADEPEALIKFYGEMFGWKFQPSPIPGAEYWLCNTGEGAGINGAVMKRRHPHQPWMNYVDVESIDRSIEMALELGAKVALPKTPVQGAGAYAAIIDPQGNICGLWERVK